MINSIKADHLFCGYRRCWAYLCYRQGVRINKKHIYRLMKENDLLVSQKRYQAKRRPARPKPKASYPNHIWRTDMTKIKISSCGSYYLVIVLAGIQGDHYHRLGYRTPCEYYQQYVKNKEQALT